MEKSYKVNSKLLPEGFPRQFDAHIYFSEEQREFAEALRNKAIVSFKDQLVFTGQLIPEPIGPHPTPMFEINFPKEKFTDVVLWLMHERGDLSVLVHELAGDDFYDHTQAAMWLGKPVDLKLEAFKD
ncbi:DOPA 4,5-dioxygenase family protein [Bdellovibrio sp. HCB274]|uniref:DOPA 4,5-dioxygenase family protein n=1 Tax=Bdellovibrio sp. HCB274 TaxID=3394361 RepID=UPI0039B49C7A